MKKILKYSAVLVAALVAGGCNLDQAPFSETATDSYVKSAAEVKTLVVGTYNGLHDVLYNEWALTELRSDNTRMRVNGSTANDTKLIEQLDQGVQTTAHAWIEDYWNACYATIDRANKVLANLGVVDDAELHDRYEGEVKFIRALLYFNLVRLYGPVFIVTRKTGADEARYMQRSPVDEVYALIEQDLTDIIDNQLLPPPSQVDKADLGHATMQAAEALLAKVYMTHYEVGSDNYMKAGDLMRSVLAAAGNPQSGAALVPYDRIFASDNEMNAEIIFAVRYLSGNVGLGCPFGTLFGPLNNGNNVIMGSPKHYNFPTDDLIGAFNAGGNDLRKEVTLKESYYNPTTGQVVEGASGRWCDKFLEPVTTEYDGDKDWPVLRVGDIALLLAEWINETSGPTDEAMTYINMIRERAGIEPYTSADVSSKYEFRVAVRNERRLELACENQRWFDLMRWNQAMTVVNEHLVSELFYGDYTYPVNPIQEWQVLLPIPISVTNINSNVAQNPGY
ncbi:MAG: RagB/SusD family nutrient uptake outer membrane protein [Alistipes sp.]|nr:RagB/SusD family nutrient uptake outer membrane protein [Alistipes sp.]